MSCKHPKKGWIIDTKENGRFQIKITEYEVDHLEKMKDGSYEKAYSPFVSARAVKGVYRFTEIGCGKCIGCRLDKAKIWKERCLAELKYHPTALFLTLTYDEVHLPYAADDDTDEAFVYNTLKKKDLQDFWKRLRKNTGQNIRYFACGEYGSKTWRPHYHAIVYGLDMDDLEIHGYNEYEQPLYTSDKLNKWWRNGFVIVGEATKESIEYVARYTCKKAYDEMRDKEIEEKGIEPEFIVMSRKPAIGKAWYDDNYEYLDHYGHAYIGDEKGSHYISYNPYFKKKKEFDSVDEMVKYKEDAQRRAIEMKKMKASLTDREYLDQLAEEEKTLLKKKVAKMRDL